MLDRILHKVKLDRKQVRVANAVFQCRPPANRVSGRYTEAAAKHCAQYIDPILAGNHKLVIPLGGSAIRRVLGLPLQVRGKSGIRVQDFHGQPMQDTEGRWIVPTFHPAVLLRKAALMGIVVWDLMRALQVLREGWQYDVPRLVIDPPVEWFADWVEKLLATIDTPAEPWVPIDVETEGKDPDEGRADLGEMLTLDHRSAKILRVNLACSLAEGITVPFMGPYIELLRRVCASSLVKVCHNEPYDRRRLELNDCPLADPVFDSMDMFHALQSDVPKGLGFIAPLASKAPAWKHLATAEPGQYGAMDGVQTLRVVYWVAQQLSKWGMWDVYERHMWLFRVRCLRPAEKVGLLVNVEGMRKFHVELVQSLTMLDAELQALYPPELKKLEPKEGLQSRPDYFDVVEHVVSKEIRICRTCGAQEVGAKHRCKDPGTSRVSKTLKAEIDTIVTGVPRFFRRHPFNPDSWQQVLAYVKQHGHEPGRNKNKGESVDKKALARLVRETQDPFYSLNQERRQTAKIDSTYVQVAIARADANSRLHAQYKEVPSTLRLSCVAPNLTNMAAGKTYEAEEVGKTYAKRFRGLVEAAPGCELMEADFSGIEAVLVGWFAGDPVYIKKAHLGVHAWLVSIVLGKPPNPRWSAEEEGAYYKELKVREKFLYEACKRCVHGTSYGLTPHGMVENYPTVFKSEKEARELQNTFFRAAPRVAAWQKRVQALAHRQGFLGGPGQHPFSYKHWFWAVKEPRRGSHGDWYEKEGPDAKRAIAYFPQSTARGVLTESLLRLFDPESENWIGDAFYGETPLRAVIHDSELYEYPVEQRQRILHAVYTEMTKPILQLPCPAEWNLGNFLTVGVEMKAGPTWAAMEVVPPVELGVAGDSKVLDEEEDEEDELLA